MRIGEIVKANQPGVHKDLNKKNNKKKRKRRDSNEEHLSFSDFESMMRHDSYYRGKGGALKQR